MLCPSSGAASLKQFFKATRVVKWVSLTYGGSLLSSSKCDSCRWWVTNVCTGLLKKWYSTVWTQHNLSKYVHLDLFMYIINYIRYFSKISTFKCFCNIKCSIRWKPSTYFCKFKSEFSVKKKSYGVCVNSLDMQRNLCLVLSLSCIFKFPFGSFLFFSFVHLYVVWFSVLQSILGVAECFFCVLITILLVIRPSALILWIKLWHNIDRKSQSVFMLSDQRVWVIRKH